MIEELILIGGSAVSYFITVYKILKAAEIQGLIHIFKCPMCNNELEVEHASQIRCEYCNTLLNVEEVGENEVKVNVVQNEGEKLVKCIDCQSHFTILKDFEGIVKCPNCPRKYYVRNKEKVFLKPIPRRKWW